MKIYVASSWRNQKQPEVVDALRKAGHDVYDFRNPAPGNSGFSWRQTSKVPKEQWTPSDLLTALRHPIAEEGFAYDMNALKSSDACVLVLPCGRSAHLELGWATGHGKKTVVLFDATLDEPELMYKMCDKLATTIDEVIHAVKG